MGDSNQRSSNSPISSDADGDDGAAPSSVTNIGNIQADAVVLGNNNSITLTRSGNSSLSSSPCQHHFISRENSEAGHSSFSSSPWQQQVFSRENSEAGNSILSGSVCVEDVLAKCSHCFRQDYLTMCGTINENPCSTQKKPLKNVFTAVNIKPDNYGCEQQHGDMMYKIFDGWEGCKQPYHVLLYGDPGIGKTTLCQKYVLDWASNDMANQHPFNQFRVVVFLKLHDVEGTLEEIVEAQLFCHRLSEAERQVFFTCMRKNPEWFLFILDGVNECNLDEIPSVKDFLANNSYRGVSVIATSRPELTRSWTELYHNFQAHFCLEGYSDQKVLEFVANHLKDDTTKAEKLTESIRASSSLMNLARTPLLTPIICEHWKKSHKLPTSPTMTKLLNYCFDAVITSHCIKERKDWNPHSNLPTSIQDQLNRLEKLAFHGVKECSMNYTQANLEQYDIDSTCDLLRAQPETSTPLKGGVHCFTHKSIQEFVAAKWLVKNWNTEEVSKEVSAMLEDTNITKFHSVLVFVAGLLSNEPNQDHLLTFIQRLSTSSANSTCACNFLQEGYYGYRMQLLLESCYEAWQKESKDEESSIAKGILSLTRTKELFRRVITPCELPLMGFAEIEGLSLVIPKLKQLTSLNLSGISIQKREAEVLANECLHGNCSLASVNFSHCCLCPHAVETICKALETMPKLEKVDLSCNNLSSKGLTAVARLLNCSTKATIKVLRLDDDFDKNHVELLQERCQSQQKRPLQKKVSRQELVHKLLTFNDQRQKMAPEDNIIQDLIIAFNDEVCELEEISLHHYQIGNQIDMWLNAFQERDSLINVRIRLQHLDENLRVQLITLVKHKPKLSICIILQEDLTAPELNKHLEDFRANADDRIKLICRCHHQSVRDIYSMLSFG